MITSSLSYIPVLLAGKPDKKKSPHRKDQLGGKGDYGNCFFYAAKLGTDWAPVQITQQKNYQYLSAHRKKIVKYKEGVWHKRQTVINVVNAIANFQAITLTATQEAKEWIIAKLPYILSIIKNQKNIREGTDQVAQEFIGQFACSSFIDLESFRAELVYKERIANHTLFLCKTNPQFKSLLIDKLNEWQTNNFIPNVDYNQLPLQRQYNIIHELFLNQAAAIFNFELASWNPLKSVKILKILIETKGFLIASGMLGKECVTSAPELYETDLHYDYYRWDSNIYQTVKGVNGHIMTIVKVEQEPEELVGLLDPADENLLGQKRKVYMLPYQLFCQSVCHSSGVFLAMNLDSYIWCQKFPVIKSQKS